MTAEMDPELPERIVNALDFSPFTRQHKLFVAALLTALVFDYIKPFTISFVIPGMRAMWDLSTVAGSYLAVAGLTGTVVGSIFWGVMADRIGRRNTLLWTIGIFSGSTLCGLSTEYWQSLLACFIMGFGVGGEAPIVFALAAEYLPIRQRGQMLLMLGIAASTLGYALAALIATVSNSFLPIDMAWRAMWLIQLVPAVLIFLLRNRVVPESARYLLSTGQVERARREAEHLVGPINQTSVPRLEHKQGVPLSRKEVAQPVTRGFVLGFFSFAWGLANYGFVTWLPTMLQGLGFTGKTSSGFLTLSALIAVPALAITAYLLMHWSTRWTLVVYALGGAISLVLMGWQVDNSSEANAGFLMVVISLVFFFITSMGGVFSLYAAEVFPTAWRARYSGIVGATGKLGGVLGPYFGGLWLARNLSAVGLEATLSVTLVLAAILLAFGGVETRGKSLEEIDSEGMVRAPIPPR